MWVEPEWGQSGDILVAQVVPLAAKLIQRRVHVDRVPEDDDVHHQAEGAELVLLALAVALSQFAAFAVEPPRASRCSERFCSDVDTRM